MTCLSDLKAGPRFMGPQRDGGPQLMRGLSDLGAFKASTLRSLRSSVRSALKVLIATEHTEPLCTNGAIFEWNKANISFRISILT